MDLGDALVNSLLGFVSGLLGGYFAGRAQIRYQLRTATSIEIRRLTIEVQRAFHNWIMRPAYTKETGDYHGGRYVGVKIDALRSYYRACGDWLDSKSRKSVERLLQGFGAHFHAHMEACGFKERRK